MDKTDQDVKEISERIIHNALDGNVPVQWLFHRIQENVFIKTTRLNSDIDFLIDGREQAIKWFDKNIDEFTMRKHIKEKKE